MMEKYTVNTREELYELFGIASSEFNLTPVTVTGVLKCKDVKLTSKILDAIKLVSTRRLAGEDTTTVKCPVKPTRAYPKIHERWEIINAPVVWNPAEPEIDMSGIWVEEDGIHLNLPNTCLDSVERVLSFMLLVEKRFTRWEYYVSYVTPVAIKKFYEHSEERECFHKRKYILTKHKRCVDYKSADGFVYWTEADKIRWDWAGYSTTVTESNGCKYKAFTSLERKDIL